MAKDLYFSTAKEMERLDKAAVASGLQIRQMMELAGWQLIPLLQELGIGHGKKVVIICGQGNKAGDGLAAARHLLNYGYLVAVVLVSKDLKPDPAHHLKLLKKMPIELIDWQKESDIAEIAMGQAAAVVDSLLGYHLDGPPREEFARAINSINEFAEFVVSYDLPSGVDATSGECLVPCVQAGATLTLALPKKVFNTKGGREKSGKVYLADIGIPDFLYNEIAPGCRPDFGPNGLVKIF